MADQQINTALRKQVADFLASPAGSFYKDKLDLLIADNYSKAEDSPELSRDYVQRAKGIREAKNELTSLAVELRQKEPRKRM